MNITPRQAGGIDWLALWSSMYDAERTQAEAVTSPDFQTCHMLRPGGDQWATRAARFAAAGRRSPRLDGFMNFLLPRLRATDTVLDLGAGAGRYVPLLAGTVARVIALEPSPAMRAQIEQRIAEEQLTNVEVLASAWPMDNPPQADVVFAAHVLYGVREFAPFVMAMSQAARRECLLYMGIQHPAAQLEPFWRRFHNEPRLPLPAALEALNALYQLGVAAAFEPVWPARPLRYATAEEALEDIRQRLRFVPDQQRDAQIRVAIAELLVEYADGLGPVNDPPPPAVIYWSPSGPDKE